MTVIRLDAATLAKIEAAGGQVTIADEAGNPVRSGRLIRDFPLDEEPNPTPEEWQAILNEGPGYTTRQVIDWLREKRGA